MEKVIRYICQLLNKIDLLLDELKGGPNTGKPDTGVTDIRTAISPHHRDGDEILVVLNKNLSRLGFLVHNHSDGELWVSLDGERCGESHYTFKLKAGETLHVDEQQYKQMYKGAVCCRWDNATGAGENSMAMVTEIFWNN